MKKLVPIPPESLKHLKKDDLKDFGYQFVVERVIVRRSFIVLRKKSVRDEFVNKNLREMLDCSNEHTRDMLPAP